MKEKINKIFPLKWNLYEILLMTICVVFTIVFAVVFKSSVFDCLLTTLSILCAILFTKGHYSGYVVGLINIVFYTIVELQSEFYGELFVNWCLLAPFYIYGFVSWLRHQDKSNQTVIVKKKVLPIEYIVLVCSQIVLCVPYYFILQALSTPHLIVSTISVGVSVVAVYLSARRSEYCFVGYIINDLVLIVLWTMQAVLVDISYLTVLLSPVFLLFNDIYGVFSWKSLKKKQKHLDDFGNQTTEVNYEN